MQEVVRISVPKSAEKGVFEGKMSAILEKKGYFFFFKSQKSEKGGLIYPTLFSYLVSKEKII